MVFDPGKAEQMNELRLQNPDADLNTLAFLADVPASEVDEYTFDNIGNPDVNANFGQVTSLQANEVQAIFPIPRTPPGTPVATDEFAFVTNVDIENTVPPVTPVATDEFAVEIDTNNTETINVGQEIEAGNLFIGGDSFIDPVTGLQVVELAPTVADSDRVEIIVPQAVEVDSQATETPTPPAVDAEAQEAAIQAQALKQQAQQQQTVNAQREASGVKNADGDWRVKLRLAPQATYLYKASEPGILAPLTVTDGVIFPYTPQIDLQYRAEYNNYQPTHSNYMSYFYKGSSVQTVQIQADFTAQDTVEAEYMLAVIHFLRSASKMFYGQDAERGSPPPLLYLSGLGEYQFNESPCVISEFNYNLPSDVNYIRARSRHVTSADNLQFQKPLATSATNGNFASLGRLATAVTNAFNGGPQPLQVGAKPYQVSPGSLGSKGATYVPTKMSMTINLLPVATRQQQSQTFSLKEYANGNLIKKGMW